MQIWKNFPKFLMFFLEKKIDFFTLIETTLPKIVGQKGNKKVIFGVYGNNTWAQPPYNHTGTKPIGYISNLLCKATKCLTGNTRKQTEVYRPSAGARAVYRHLFIVFSIFFAQK